MKQGAKRELEWVLRKNHSKPSYANGVLMRMRCLISTAWAVSVSG